jgi:hypothetical protein
MKLYEIPKKSIIKTKSATGKDVDILFWHIDGAYSYCTIEDGDPDNVIHLSASTPLKKVNDYYVFEEDLTLK